jgi:hypothetical protein
VLAQGKTLGVGSLAETAEASEAHFCVPYLRNGALEALTGPLAERVRDLEELSTRQEVDADARGVE